MRRVALQPLVEFLGVSDGLHLETLLGQVAHQQVPQACVIIDDKYFGIGLFHDFHRIGRAAFGPVIGDTVVGVLSPAAAYANTLTAQCFPPRRACYRL